MQILKAGDVRQEGDETRGKIASSYSRAQQFTSDYDYHNMDAWLPVRLLGHSILPADLIVSEFRHP